MPRNSDRASTSYAARESRSDECGRAFVERDATATQESTGITPAFPDESVAVCFSSDSAYAPYLAAAISSVISHASPERFYDINILHNSIPAPMQEAIRSMRTANVSIRFRNISALLQEYGYPMPTRIHFTEATYYRFFVPYLFRKYEKVIYLDCDLVVNRDIAELYQTPMTASEWLAAANDTFVRYCILSGDRYFTEKLGLEHPERYFQAGVLIFHIPPLTKFDFARAAFELLHRMGTPRFLDQDVLNLLCQEHVHDLDLRWNLEWHIPLGVCENWRGILPPDILAEYDRAYHDPWIIHYCGREKKPWRNPDAPPAHYFWAAVRGTPFYESIIYNSLLGMMRDFYELPKLRRKLTLIRIKMLFSFGARRRRLKAEKRYIKERIHTIRFSDSFIQTSTFKNH